MSYSLFIDDLRDPPRDGRAWVIARSVPAAIETVSARGIPNFIAFDHDLGPHPVTGLTHDVMDFCRWFENLVLDTMPDLTQFRYQVHSANPPGRDNIISWIEALLKHARNGY